MHWFTSLVYWSNIDDFSLKRLGFISNAPLRLSKLFFQQRRRYARCYAQDVHRMGHAFAVRNAVGWAIEKQMHTCGRASNRKRTPMLSACSPTFAAKYFYAKTLYPGRYA